MTEVHPIYVYVAIGGYGFDVHAYAKYVGPLAGRIVTRKHVGPPLEDEPPTYWSGNPTATSRGELSRSLQALLTSLKESRPLEFGGQVTVQIVDEAVNNEDRGGYHLTPEIVSLLAELRCDLGIDVRTGSLS